MNLALNVLMAFLLSVSERNYSKRLNMIRLGRLAYYKIIPNWLI